MKTLERPRPVPPFELHLEPAYSAAYQELESLVGIANQTVQPERRHGNAEWLKAIIARRLPELEITHDNNTLSLTMQGRSVGKIRF